MTEKKAELSLLKSCSELTCEALFTSAYPGFDSSDKKQDDFGGDSVLRGMYELFNTELASEYFSPYLLGEEKIKVYGNPMIMRAHSGHWRIMGEMNGFISDLKKTDKSVKRVEENYIHVAPHIQVGKFALQTVNCWSFMNGITDEPCDFVSLDRSNDASIQEVFRVLELCDYFQINININVLPECVDCIEKITSNWTYLDLERMELIGRMLTWSAKLGSKELKSECQEMLTLDLGSYKKNGKLLSADEVSKLASKRKSAPKVPAFKSTVNKKKVST